MKESEKRARERIKDVQSRGRVANGDPHTYKDRGQAKDATKSAIRKVARAVNKYIEGDGPR